MKSFDAAKAEKMPGVKKVVQVADNAVAVVADTFWHAKMALEAVTIDWDTAGNEKHNSATIAEFLKAGLDADKAFVGNENGDIKAAIAGAAKKVEAVYNYPYQNHACMEPMNATALYTDDKCEVWCGTQDGEGAFGAVVQTSGLPADKCDVHKVMLGGGFGRRGRADYIIQAVQIAKQMPGTPIKLLWTREEDMQHGFYHPITQCKMTGTFDKDNNLTGLHMRISGQSILATVFPSAIKDGKDPVTFQGLNPSGETAFGYSVPNLLIDHAMRNPHVPAGFWRGVNVNHNAIYVECFMDELAHSIGVDALEFRRKLMGKNPKNLAVLNAAAERIGWGKPAEKGRFRGLSQMMAFGSYVAGAAEISVDGDKIKIHKLIGATDPGLPSIRRRSSGRSRGRSSTGSRRCSMANAPSRTATSSRPTSTPTTRSASRRCRWWSRSACRAATPHGVASANRPSWSRRRPCSMPTSTRRASASARSR